MVITSHADGQWFKKAAKMLLSEPDPSGTNIGTSEHAEGGAERQREGGAKPLLFDLSFGSEQNSIAEMWGKVCSTPIMMPRE
jgi:hypothetical protein